MKGGTLVASKLLNFHERFKRRFEELGFENVTVTSAEKDGLYMVLRELKPKIFIIGSSYYKCLTPYILAGIHKAFPRLYIAAISLTTDYPPALARAFIDNGVKSYVNYWDDHDEFYKAIEIIKNGKVYVPEHIEKMRAEAEGDLETVDYLTDRQLQIIRCIGCGWTAEKIGNALQITTNTLDNSRARIYRALGVRNQIEMIVKALRDKLIDINELVFYSSENNYLTMHKKTGRRNYGFTSKKQQPESW